MMQKDNHVFKGIKRDVHPINQDSSFLWDALNIRFTRKDNESFLSMTNEVGPSLVEGLKIKGKYYLGHCILGKYLIVFTTTDDGSSDDEDLYTGEDYITRITKDGHHYTSETLFEGVLNFKRKHLIQTLGNYESPLVQKVYWTDGYNQPRFINIVADKLYNKDLSTITDYYELYPEGIFDFVPNLLLNEEVSVSKVVGGQFSPGTIQYAFTYYNKYGQESNIFYITPLLYISPYNRGGNPEETVNNAFTISIKNTETKFDYLRVYSIHRTSQNTTPQFKVVHDILLQKDINSEINEKEIVFTDTGTTGYTEDPSKLLFIGGEEIIAGCFCEKDNTLFLGNIEIKKPYISTQIKDLIKQHKDDISITEFGRTLNIDNNIKPNEQFELNTCKSITSFRKDNYYRLGIQFQYKTGKWSEPIFLKDIQISSNNNRVNDNGNIELNSLKLDLKNDLLKRIITIAQNSEFKKIRGVVVLPKPHERIIITQGVINPTVFEIHDRYNNAPFAQASWFFRPLSSSSLDSYNTPSISNSSLRKIASRPYQPLNYTLHEHSFSDTYPSDNYLNEEVQGEGNLLLNKLNRRTLKSKSIEYMVDQSILTLNSPELEFEEITSSIEQEFVDISITGLISGIKYLSDINVDTLTPPPTFGNSNSQGFMKIIPTGDRLYNEALYQSSVLKNDSSIVENSESYRWFIYPWQVGGSINNDIAKEEGKSRSSVLKSKTISNLLFSYNNYYFNTPYKYPAGITKVSLFNNDGISLIKLNTPGNSNLDDINYYGNVDTVKIVKGQKKFINPTNDFELEKSNIKIPTNVDSGYAFYNAGTRISYKSSPHLVFSTNYIKENPVVLPGLVTGVIDNKEFVAGINTPYQSSAHTTPYWIRPNVTATNEVQKKAPSAKIITTITDVTLGLLIPWIKIRDEVLKLGGINDNNIDIACQQLIHKNNISIPNTALIAIPSSTKGSIADEITYYRLVRQLGWQYVIPNINTRYIVPDAYPTIIGSFKNKYLEATEINNRKLLLFAGTIDTGGGSGGSEDVHNNFYDATSKIYQDKISSNVSSIIDGSLFLANLERSVPVNLFNGDSEDAVLNNLWLPGGEPVSLDADELIYDRGDTYYQRYDCLKTYPYNKDNENNIIEILSFMCESYINLDGRYDRNRLKQDNLHVSPINFNLMNDSYSQEDNIFNYRILDDFTYRSNKYPLQVIWTSPHTALSDVDEWTHITLANSIDLNGDCGKVTSINKFNELLIAFQEHATIRLLYNDRVQVSASDGVPIELANSQKMQGTQIISNKIGCQDRLHTKETPQGIYFIDNNASSFWLFNGSLSNIGETAGCSWWFREHNKNVKFPEMDSKILSYDNINNDLYINLVEDKESNENSLCYSEKLGNFTSRMSYSNVVMDTIENDFISISTRSIEQAGEYLSPINLYLNNKGYPNDFFGYVKLPKFTFISNENPTITKIFDTIEYKASIDRGTIDTSRSTFDWIRAYNDYQDTGVKKLTSSIKNTFFDDASVQKKFRTWKAQLPRANKLQRLRDSWTAIELGFNVKPTDNTRPDARFDFILHNISSIYSI
jgi:hypothetical protein